MRAEELPPVGCHTGTSTTTATVEIPRHFIRVLVYIYIILHQTILTDIYVTKNNIWYRLNIYAGW